MQCGAQRTRAGRAELLGEQIAGESGRLELVNIKDLAPEMRPAGDLGDPAAGVGLVVNGLSIGLQISGVAGKMLLWRDQ